MDINPHKIDGHWKEGWALDFHTLSSRPIVDLEGNITGWDTKRPPIAEELYRLKYWRERYRVDLIAKATADFIIKYKATWQLDRIIPIPPSDTNRQFQPVYEIAKAVGLLSGISIDFTILTKTKSTAELKDMRNPSERRRILDGAFHVIPNALSEKHVLIFDDLYRSGETLNAACDVIVKSGNAKSVYVLTITKTRSKK